MNILVRTIDGIQEILAICPHCKEIFRLVEGKFILPQKRPRTCEYLELIALEGKLSDAKDRLASAKERFDRELEERRELLREKGVSGGKDGSITAGPIGTTPPRLDGGV